MRKAIQQILIDSIIFLIPALKFIEIETVGRLLFTDIVFLALFPIILILKFNKLHKRIVIQIIILGLIWLSSQVLTDIIRGTPSNDYYRGWAKIIVTTIHFCIIYLIINNNRRIVVFILGLCAGDILGYFFNPNIYSLYFPWKFGFGSPVTYILILLACIFFNRYFVISIILLIFSSIINLYMDFRSLSGICFITVIYLLIQESVLKTNNIQARLKLKDIVVLFSILLLSGLTFLKGYETLAKKGLLGESAQMKYYYQSSGDYGIIVGGRSEILISIYAIVHSPLVGYGSWAKNYQFIELLNNFMNNLGYVQPFLGASDVIPTHSHFFGSWVESGIGGALFWGFIITLILRVFITRQNKNNLMTPLIIFVSFHLLWDIFFSPFGSDQRFIEPLFFTIMINYLPENYTERARSIYARSIG